MRRVIVSIAFALLAGACGGSDTGRTAAPTTTTIATSTPSTTEAPGTTGAPGTTSIPGATTTTRVPPDGEAAPDFTLALGDGGTFTLSDEQKPVYMIFWAEW
jgi:hypothetical protein